MMKYYLPALICLLLFLAGCGTIGNLVNGHPTVSYPGVDSLDYDQEAIDAYDPDVYGGIKNDYDVIIKPAHVLPLEYIDNIIYLFDLPLSLVADTATLPYTITYDLVQVAERKKKEPSEKTSEQSSEERSGKD